MRPFKPLKSTSVFGVLVMILGKGAVVAVCLFLNSHLSYLGSYTLLMWGLLATEMDIIAKNTNQSFHAIRLAIMKSL